MNTALWIVAGLLALSFLVAGLFKILRTRAQLDALGMAWVEDFSTGTIKFIGVMELLAAVGLILPGALDVFPIVVPIAATGLAALDLMRRAAR